jgi:hypothetical protein
MYIIYDKTSDWEIDYITRDILADYHDNRHLLLLTTAEIAALQGAAADNPIIGNNILIFTSNCISYRDISAVIRAICPRVVIHLSEEFGIFPEYLQIAALTPLYIRNYNHAAYAGYVTLHPRALQIPLGYITGTLGGKRSEEIGPRKPLSDRTIRWAFIGNMKQDRAEMCAAFRARLGNGFTGTGMSPHDMYGIYSNTVFVPVGRGNVTVDCFRIYEAVVAGAIPVIVGTPEECRVVFAYGGNPPPFLFATSWSAAADAAAEMTSSECADMQERILGWWKSRLVATRKAIAQATAMPANS